MNPTFIHRVGDSDAPHPGQHLLRQSEVPAVSTHFLYVAVTSSNGESNAA